VSFGGKGATELRGGSRRGGESAETARGEAGMGCVSGGRVVGWPSRNTNCMQHPGGYTRNETVLSLANFFSKVFL
jgi:hypothetical protein